MARHNLTCKEKGRKVQFRDAKSSYIYTGALSQKYKLEVSSALLFLISNHFYFEKIVYTKVYKVHQVSLKMDPT